MKSYKVEITRKTIESFRNIIASYPERKQLNMLIEMDGLLNNLSIFPLLGTHFGFDDKKEIRRIYIKPYYFYYFIDRQHERIVIYAFKHYREYERL